jgi:hypothetical protein
MSNQDMSLWTFVNSRNSSQKAHVVGLNSAILLTSLFIKEELKYWIVKKKDWPSSKYVVDCTELFPDADSFSEGIPLVDVGTLNKSISIIDTGSSIKIKKEKIDNRKSKRVAGRLAVTIFLEQHVYKSFSKNLSIGGLLLEAPVPQLFSRRICRVEVSSPDKSITVEFLADVKDISEKGTRLIFTGDQARSSLKQMALWVDQFTHIADIYSGKR